MLFDKSLDHGVLQCKLLLSFTLLPLLATLLLPFAEVNTRRCTGVGANRVLVSCSLFILRCCEEANCCCDAETMPVANDRLSDRWMASSKQRNNHSR